MPEISPKDFYSRSEVLRLLSITERQLRVWERHDLVQPGDLFSFPDLIALRTIIKLRDNRVPIAQIRGAVTALREKIADVSDPLRELKVFSEGKRIRVEIAGQHMEPVSGQLLFNFDQKELRRLLAFPGRSKQQEREQREAAERWFQKALQLEHNGAPIHEIIEAYDTALKLDPSSCGALVNLGTVHFNAKSWPKAEACYRKALELNAEYPLAHFNIANLYDEMGETQKAITHYSHAVRLNPQYADAHYNLALLHQGNGQVMEAVRHWQSYLKLDPASAWAAIARRELGKLKRTTLLDGNTSR